MTDKLLNELNREAHSRLDARRTHEVECPICEMANRLRKLDGYIRIGEESESVDVWFTTMLRRILDGGSGD